MKVQYYEEVFEVTETCNNGNERRIKKSVLCQPFSSETGRHRPTEQRVSAAAEVLKSEHYYNIVHIESKIKNLLFA